MTTRWCYYSFETLNPNHPHPHLRTFVQCQACKAKKREIYYHTEFWNRLGQCILCGSEGVSAVEVPPPPPVVLQRRDRPLLLKPIARIRQFATPKPLTGANLLHQARWFYWLTFDPPSAAHYTSEHKPERAATLDWWLATTILSLTAFFVLVGVLTFVTLRPTYPLSYLAMGTLTLWFFTGVLGARARGLRPLVGMLLFAIMAGGTLFLALSNSGAAEALLTSIRRSDWYVISDLFRWVEVQAPFSFALSSAALGSLAIAFAIALQTVRYLSVRAVGLSAGIVLAAWLLYTYAPWFPLLGLFLIGGVGCGLLYAILRTSQKQPRWEPLARSIGLAFMVSLGTLLFSALPSLLNPQRFTLAEVQARYPVARTSLSNTSTTDESNSPRPIANPTQTVPPKVGPTLGSRQETRRARARSLPTLYQLADEPVDFDRIDERWQRGDTATIIPVTLTTSESALLWHGWCAADLQTLNANLGQMEFRFTLDAEAIPSNALEQVKKEYEEGLWCLNYALLLTDWPVGRYELVATTQMKRNLTDGTADFPRATHTTTFNILVERP